MCVLVYVSRSAALNQLDITSYCVLKALVRNVRQLITEEFREKT